MAVEVQGMGLFVGVVDYDVDCCGVEMLDYEFGGCREGEEVGAGDGVDGGGGVI